MAWGLLGDRFGHKLCLLGAQVCLLAAVAVALAAPSLWWLGVAFALSAAAVAAMSVSRFAIVIEFAPPALRPTYISLAGVAIAPASAVAPLVGGWLADLAGYPATFLVCGACGLLGGALLLSVRDPRWSRASDGAGEREAEATCLKGS